MGRVVKRAECSFVPLAISLAVLGCSEPVMGPRTLDAEEADLVVVLPYMEPEVVEEQRVDAEPGVLDVHFSVDTTASFQGEIEALRDSLSARLVPNLRERVADVAFGVSSFEDFPVSPYGLVNVDHPFTLLTPITEDVDLAQEGVESLELGNGSDVPECGYEALWQIATGDGFEPWVDPYEGAGEGGVGFRPGSFRVVVHITDALSHTPTSYGTAVPGTHSAAEVAEAMRALGISVVGVASHANPMPQLQELAIATGATIDPVDGSCPTGRGGRSAPPVDGVCPLVFEIGANGEGLGDAIEDALVELLDTVEFGEVYTRVTGDDQGFVRGVEATSFSAPVGSTTSMGDARPADGVADTFLDVTRGTEVGFALRFRNTTVEPGPFTQGFPMVVEIQGDDNVLRRLNVHVLVPGEGGLPDDVTGGGAFTAGACSAGGDARGTAWMLLAMLALLGLGRRRGRGLAIAMIAMVATTLVGSASVQAQRFDVQRFAPAPSQRTGTIGLLHGETLERDSIEAGLVLHYDDSPLVVRGESGARFAEIVSQQLTGHVVGGFGLFGVGEVLVDLPFILHQHGDLVPVLSNLDSNASGAGFGVGDLRIVGKFGLVDTNTRTNPGGLALSLYVQAQLPTGKRHYFQGGQLRATPGVAFDAIGARGHRLTANVGYTIRPRVTLMDELDVDDTLDFGLALTLALTDWMRGIVEVRGSVSVLADDIGLEELPLEGTLGVKMNNEWASLMVAGGVGLTGGFGTPDYRVILAASYTGTQEAPRYDFDHDDIYDDVDQCPHEAEDRDGFEDHDGCPEDDDEVDDEDDDEADDQVEAHRPELPAAVPAVTPAETPAREPRRGRGIGAGLLVL